jgi:archaellum component FlaG (FlaF/FlaG flagellin family)
MKLMGKNTVRSQAAVDYLVLLAAVLLIVASIVTIIYVGATDLGSSVEKEIENTVSEVEDLLMGLIFGWV